MTNELSKVSKFWSKNEPVLDSWGFYTSPLMRPYIIETAYGKDLVGEYPYHSSFAEDIFISKYLRGKKIKSILSLCCGFGSVKRRLVSQLADVQT